MSNAKKNRKLFFDAIFVGILVIRVLFSGRYYFLASKKFQEQ
ncbi:hypothetical protein RV05_GL002069 [Enterococcus hirae]|nr:hypothetical protein RV05_GL002069 [Enterococcus hirae]